ncbi:MAG TPA: UbiA family prenyltransferase, partial [Bacteroidales bacterium]|nr:UbiA family prenyltransferase [Bacteroidales bacterium]
MLTKIKYYFSLVKFVHTVFSLPFALIGFFIGLNDNNSKLSFYKLIMVLFAVFFARNAAMAFNRYADKEIDKKNTRTANREIPSGKIKPQEALIFVIFNIILF